MHAIARSTPIGLVCKLRRPDLNVTHISPQSRSGGWNFVATCFYGKSFKNPKNEDLDNLERNKDMGDMLNSADGAAGSKIFVGGLDRSVDEGACFHFL